MQDNTSLTLDFDTDATLTEEWRSIPNHPDYQVSNQGRVKRMTARICGKPGHILIPDPCGRYSRVQLCHFGRVNVKAVHLLVLYAFEGLPPIRDIEGCHNDGNSHNNSLSNLRWDTSQGNQADRIAHGTYCGGAKHYKAKLSEEQVKEIRILHSSGIAYRQLAKQFNVNKNTISSACLYKTWKYI